MELLVLLVRWQLGYSSQSSFSPVIALSWVRDFSNVVNDPLIQFEQIKHLMDSDSRYTEFLGDLFHGFIGGVVIDLLISKRCFDVIWFTFYRLVFF